MAIDLGTLIYTFVTGADVSIASANAIETALDAQFPEDDFVQQTVEMLAMYRPGGGAFLFDEASIKAQLLQTADYIKTRSSTAKWPFSSARPARS